MARIIMARLPGLNAAIAHIIAVSEPKTFSKIILTTLTGLADSNALFNAEDILQTRLTQTFFNIERGPLSCN